MIVVKEFPGRTFKNRAEVIGELRNNKEAIIAAKKMQTKHADAVVFVTPLVTDTAGKVIKEGTEITQDTTKIVAKVVINTTNLFDSHTDVHINGIWNKSVKEKKDLYLLQEHKMTFANIISDEVTASVQKMTFKELGYDLDGDCEALVFDVIIDKNRNPFMFDQYARKYVKNHSVGMRYVKIEMAIDSNSEWDKDEKEVWDKYIDVIANKEEAMEHGYFFAVTEAKIIEGSAVPVGSNWATPTISTEAAKGTSKAVPHKSTPILSKLNELVTQSKI